MGNKINVTAGGLSPDLDIEKAVIDLAVIMDSIFTISVYDKKVNNLIRQFVKKITEELNELAKLEPIKTDACKKCEKDCKDNCNCEAKLDNSDRSETIKRLTRNVRNSYSLMSEFSEFLQVYANRFDKQYTYIINEFDLINDEEVEVHFVTSEGKNVKATYLLNDLIPKFYDYLNKE